MVVAVPWIPCWKRQIWNAVSSIGWSLYQWFFSKYSSGFNYQLKTCRYYSLLLILWLWWLSDIGYACDGRWNENSKSWALGIYLSCIFAKFTKLTLLDSAYSCPIDLGKCYKEHEFGYQEFCINGELFDPLKYVSCQVSWPLCCIYSPRFIILYLIFWT